jgi:HEAT repeat protein
MSEEPGRRGSARAERKARVEAFLHARDLEALRAWGREVRNPLSTLVSFLSATDDLLRWRAIEALGLLAEDTAARDLGTVRDLVRRQLWSMNDESGGIAWHAPEAVGEILFRVPALAREFASILASHHATPPFEAGVQLALERLAELDPRLVAPEEPKLLAALSHPEAAARGAAAASLGVLAPANAAAALRGLVEDRGVVTLYDRSAGTLETSTVGALARGALAKIEAR